MKRFRPQLVPGIFFIIALAILLSLGTWQVKRMNWKNNLIETITSRVNQSARSLPAMAIWKQLDLEDLNYRPVEARGTYLKEEVHIFTQVAPGNAYSGTGFWVIAPFYLERGGVVLVNRGFVPERFKQSRTRTRNAVRVLGEQTITGIIKTNQGTNYFTPQTDFKRNIWFTRDAGAIAEHLELKNAAPFFITLTKAPSTGDLPQPREIKVKLPNNHLGYAITWFGLALTLIGVFGVFSFRKSPE